VIIERHRLANGLVVCLAPEAAVPVVALSLWYRVGSADERQERTGLAHLFEHLMFQGSANVGKGQHFQLIQAAGGRANAATGMDRTYYHERLPAHQLELAIWLEAERLGHLLVALDQAKLDNQRDVVRNERRFRVDNQPYGDAEERMHALLYPERHPYAHEILGSMEDLAAASLEDVRGFFGAYYAPNSAVLSIAGDFEADRAISLVRKHFDRLPATPTRPPTPSFTAPRDLGGPIHSEVVDSSIPLGRVYLAFRIPPLGTPAWDALDVVADLLARGRASRLFIALVRAGRAHEVAAWAETLIGDPARFTIQATAHPHVPVDELADEVLAEVDRLARDGPDEAELERVRQLRHTEIASSMERVEERADRIGMYASLLGDPERVNSDLARYSRVDRAAVKRVVDGFLRRERAMRLIYRPTDGSF
jgi:zinc protease